MAFLLFALASIPVAGSIRTVIKPGGFAVFVVADRKVKGQRLPSDKIIVDMSEILGFSHVDTLHRDIPSKRLPLKNSPTNVSGVTEETMLTEQIVVLQKLIC